YLFTRPQPTDEYFVQGRIDHQFSMRDSVFGRFTFDNGTADRPPILKLPFTITSERSRNQYVTMDYQHNVSSTMVNIFRLGFNRSDHESTNRRTIDVPPTLTWVPGQPLGYLTISGIVTENFGDYRLPRLDRLNNYQTGDTLFL